MPEIRKIWEYYDAPDLVHWHDEVNRENRKAIRLMGTVGVPLGIANMFAQWVIAGHELFSFKNSVLLIGFFALFFFDRCLLPDDYPHSTRLVYLVEAPLLMIAILLGSVWDPNHTGITVLIFMMAMPVFILDRPIRILIVAFGWAGLYLLIAYLTKPFDIFRVDLVHVVEFFMASWAESHIILKVRLEALKGREQIRYHLEHDELTGAQNRRALTDRVEQYLGKPLLLMLGDMDQLTFYNDFYGHDVGDELLLSFTGLLRDSFGEKHSYRYGGDEMLCVAVGLSEEECLERMEQCRKRLRNTQLNGQAISVSCTFGYVIGCPATAKEFFEMIQLADIYVHKANKIGRDQTLGGPFDAAHLRAGILESYISTHARAYETNQLTGLPSMSYFIARSDELLKKMVDMKQRPVMGFFNLIQFRDYNDAFGYAQGDELIRYTAKLLKESFPNRNICYITGSQFGILCYMQEVEHGLKQVHAALQSYKPGFQIHCKAGFAEYTGSQSAISLMDMASAAHNSIRKQRNVLYRYYDGKLNEESHFRQYLVSHLDEAIEKGYLKVYYQPIVRTLTGKVCNEEALSRWDDPVYGFLAPYRFIPTLEENRLIYKVNLNVIRQVLRDFQRRQELGVPIVPVSVNLSRYDFEQCDMVQQISELVDASGFSRDLIKIEVTESAFVENQELLKREVTRFRQNGFEVWMDDFGSEYSTLNLLQELDFDLIKIDMQFMKNFSYTGKNGIIVSDIIDMARKMGITTLVEGVEVTEQYHILQKLGCEKVQGYLFNKPNPFDYIANRFLTKSGLTFEQKGESSYYADIAQIDLNAPFTTGEKHNTFHFSSEIPSGIMEYQNGELTCIRGTGHFFRRMQNLRMIAENQGEQMPAPLSKPMPADLEKAIERCMERDDWVSFMISHRDGREYSFYLRRVSVNPFSGCTALLAVLLSAQTH